MRPLHLPALPALIALVLLGACRDASETLVGPPQDGADFAENEHGAVAWALTQNWGASWLYHWGLDGGTAQTPLAVIPASLVLGDDGGVAGTGRSPGTTTQRSFLWRRPGDVAYYRRSSQVHAINGVGDIVESAAVLTGTHATKLWNERPTWFNAAENHPPLANPGKYAVQAGESIVVDDASETLKVPTSCTSSFRVI